MSYRHHKAILSQGTHQNTHIYQANLTKIFLLSESPYSSFVGWWLPAGSRQVHTGGCKPSMQPFDQSASSATASTRDPVFYCPLSPRLQQPLPLFVSCLLTSMMVPWLAYFSSLTGFCRSSLYWKADQRRQSCCAKSNTRRANVVNTVMNFRLPMCLLPSSCWLLVCLTIHPWRWR
jgi:hypothetical protein